MEEVRRVASNNKKADFQTKLSDWFDKHVTIIPLLKILPEPLRYQLENSKTIHCKHNFNCCEHILKRSVKSFLYGFSLAFVLELVQILLKRKASVKLSKRLLLTISESLHFSLFPLIYTFILKSVHCVGRRILGRESGKTAFIAGFSAGLLSMLAKQ
jgi:hypothetical protein